jgi:hypothetical protein
MANVTITGLTPASKLTGTEVLAIDQSGSTVKTTVQDVANLAGGGFTLTTVGTLGTSPSVMYSVGSKFYASTAAGIQTLSYFSHPIISLFGSGFSPAFSGTLSSITISGVSYLEINAENISSLVTVNLPELTSIVTNYGGVPVNISFQGCSSLTTLNIPSLNYVSDSIFMNYQGNAFSEATVDNLLVLLAATTSVDGYLILSQGTNAAPSSTGLAAKATLEGRGWSVSTN